MGDVSQQAGDRRDSVRPTTIGLQRRDYNVRRGSAQSENRHSDPSIVAAVVSRPEPTLITLDPGARARALFSLQQAVGNKAVQRMLAAESTLQRVPEKLGTRVVHPKGVKSKFKKVAADFDGRTFNVEGDGKSLISVSAQSGRPYTVRKSDAVACKGAESDSYMNNPRYVGVSDNGPIPEGDYQFKATSMTTFSAAEQAKMLLGGSYVDPAGVSLHGGDWGAGRVSLAPVSILPSKYCGNTAKRSGFYLHGGIMPGSSGCIDIGDAPFSQLVSLVLGFMNPVTVKVRYKHGAPSVGPLDRAAGRFMYPDRGKKKDPTLWERLGSVISGDDD